MMIPYVPIRLDREGTTPTGEIIVGPTPHQYLAINSLMGLLERQGFRWKGIRPSRIPYRRL